MWGILKSVSSFHHWDWRSSCSSWSGILSWLDPWPHLMGCILGFHRLSWSSISMRWWSGFLRWIGSPKSWPFSFVVVEFWLSWRLGRHWSFLLCLWVPRIWPDPPWIWLVWVVVRRVHTDVLVVLSFLSASLTPCLCDKLGWTEHRWSKGKLLSSCCSCFLFTCSSISSVSFSLHLISYSWILHQSSWVSITYFFSTCQFSTLCSLERSKKAFFYKELIMRLFELCLKLFS